MLKYSYLLFAVILTQACPQRDQEVVLPQALEDGKIEMVFYNVENLFDIYDNPDTEDEEFLPSSEKQWNQERYQKKQADIFRVLNSLSEQDFPEIIGFSEIENATVLKDFISQKTFAGKKYAFIHKDSPDVRGIDVALIYNTEVFKPVYSETLKVDLPEPFSEDKTRDILYVEGDLVGERVHLFVNHWSSRRGGVEKSEPKRVKAANVALAKIATIQKKEKAPLIVLMGDFNDGPNNKSICEVLNAKGNFTASSEELLFNPFHALSIRGIGSYKYKENWNMLDQIILSKDMLNQDNPFYASWDDCAGILQKNWMMFRDKKYGLKPNRTYGGPNYYGGFSDHLPVYVTLTYPKPQ